MNRYEGRGPATRFGTSQDQERGREDERFGTAPGMRGMRDDRDDSTLAMRDRAFEGGRGSSGGNCGGPTQGPYGSDYRGGYPSNGPDRGRGWSAGPAWARDENDGWRGEGPSIRERQDRFDNESYRDREGRFGTTYGMSQGGMRESGRFEGGMRESGMREDGMREDGMRESGMRGSSMHDRGNRDFGRGTYDYADFRDHGGRAGYQAGYQENEGWGGRGLEEMRTPAGHEEYDPRYSRQDARRFGGQQRFGQGWEADRFQSHSRSSQAYVPGDRFGAMGGGFAGRGPKGYQRSDERIREEICEMLSRQGRIDASEVDVKVAGGEVTLTGTVTQRGDKLDIEHIVEHISGVKDVKNEIRRAGLVSGQSAHTGNLVSANAPNPGGSPTSAAKAGDNGNKNPSSRHSS